MQSRELFVSDILKWRYTQVAEEIGGLAVAVKRVLE